MKARVDEAEKPQLKVIDDEELALAEEAYVLMKEEEENFKSSPSKGSDIVDVIVNDGPVIDLEATWGIEKGIKSLPIGWLILSFLIIGGSVTWLFISEKGKGGEVARQSLLGNEDTRALAKQEEGESAELVDSLFENISAYFAAKSISEKLKFVRYPDRVKALMEEYYGRNEIKTKEVVRILSQRSLSLDFRLYNAVFVEMADGSKESVLVELFDDGDMKIDWEGHVCYLPVPWDEYIEKRPIGSFLMRVYVQRIEYYTYDFSDDEKYTSYKLTARDFDGHLYAYTLNDSEAGRKMNDHMNKVVKSGQKKPQPLMLEVSFPMESRRLDQIVIDDFVATSWVYSKPLTKIEGE